MRKKSGYSARVTLVLFGIVFAVFSPYAARAQEDAAPPSFFSLSTFLSSVETTVSTEIKQVAESLAPLSKSLLNSYAQFVRILNPKKLTVLFP